MTSHEVHILGTGLASRMSMAQLEAAMLLYRSLKSPPEAENSISIPQLRRVFLNHVRSCLRMPAGGAMGGGSQQSGFEMEMVTAVGARLLLSGWPNHESRQRGRCQSWELRSMEEMQAHLDFGAAGWGALMGKPIPTSEQNRRHTGVILAGPPFTVTWATRPDETTTFCVRFPIILWTENDATVSHPQHTHSTRTSTIACARTVPLLN